MAVESATQDWQQETAAPPSMMTKPEVEQLVSTSLAKEASMYMRIPRFDSPVLQNMSLLILVLST